MISLIDDTIITVRRIASELRPSILDDLGLIAALEWQGQEFEKRTGVKSYLNHDILDFNPEKELSTTIFRVYQEALTNITRHAHATQVETTIEIKDNYITLIVKDNGCGIDLNNVNYKNSLGLIGMKERALLFKGDLTIECGKSKGTIIILKIPLIHKNKTSS
jgi:signal transduction histidine kinase